MIDKDKLRSSKPNYRKKKVVDIVLKKNLCIQFKADFHHRRTDKTTNMSNLDRRFLIFEQRISEKKSQSLFNTACIQNSKWVTSLAFKVNKVTICGNDFEALWQNAKASAYVWKECAIRAYLYDDRSGAFPLSLITVDFSFFTFSNVLMTSIPRFV